MNTQPERSTSTKKQEIPLYPESKNAWHTPELHKSELREYVNLGGGGTKADLSNTTSATMS